MDEAEDIRSHFMVVNSGCRSAASRRTDLWGRQAACPLSPRLNEGEDRAALKALAQDCAVYDDIEKWCEKVLGV